MAEQLFDRINATIKEIEEIEEEIAILLSMHKLTFTEYTMIKRGSMDYPEHLEMWKLEQIDGEVERLREKINDLVKIRKEFLIFA